MQMLYNSDSFVVVQFDVAETAEEASAAAMPAATHLPTLSSLPALSPRGGYEIVDKFLRKEIFLDGAMAQSFRAGVDALIETGPSEDEMDAYIDRFSSLMQQPVVLH